jgi:alpha-D-ribose 1-methylphosphonate 5-triphosphate synthase subunit PhnG
LFLAGYGLVDVFVRWVIEEAGAVVLLGEAFEGSVFVLLNSGVDVAGYAYVEGSG